MMKFQEYTRKKEYIKIGDIFHQKRILLYIIYLLMTIKNNEY